MYIVTFTPTVYVNYKKQFMIVMIIYNYHHSTKLYRKYHKFVAVCITSNNANGNK